MNFPDFRNYYTNAEFIILIGSSSNLFSANMKFILLAEYLTEWI